MKKPILFSVLISNLFFSQSRENKALKDNECPAPTREQYSGLCHNIFQKQMVELPKPGVSYSYQETIWEMSCAKPGFDTIESAKPKIQKMWNKYRENMRCYNYPTSAASERNITKFSLDVGFNTMLTEAVKRYDLDMNFIDPGDGKTILDFIKEREAYVRSAPPVDFSKADEYQRIYQLLKSKGAKHKYELNK